MAREEPAAQRRTADVKLQPTPACEPKSVEAAELLAKVERLLRDGQAAKALDLLRRAKVSSPWVTNATAVCLMRHGQAQAAVDVLRGLVLSSGITLKAEAPAVFKTNFATALLLTGNVSGCLNALADVNDEHHPAVQRLRTAIRRWKEGLTFWQKVQWYLGSQLTQKVGIDFPPGDL